MKSLGFIKIHFLVGSGYFDIKTAAAAVFRKKDAAWPQGQKKNFVKLPSDLKTPKGQKEAKRDF